MKSCAASLTVVAALAIFGASSIDPSLAQQRGVLGTAQGKAAAPNLTLATVTPSLRISAAQFATGGSGAKPPWRSFEVPGKGDRGVPTPRAIPAIPMIRPTMRRKPVGDIERCQTNLYCAMS